MDQLRRPGRARPALVGCRDVQIGPHGQRGNQLGLDAVRQSDGAGRTLPFLKERTDVLTCQSKTDIENTNLMATLLSHDQHVAYWKHLGCRFVADVEALLMLTTRSSSPPSKSSWPMPSKNMHVLG
jgi:hypothetical protein